MKRRFHVIKTFETEVAFDVMASDIEEARQLALEADKDDPLMNKDFRLSGERVQSVEEHMPTWHFHVVERFQRDVSVEAPTQDDAKRLVDNLYGNGEILLDSHDFKTYGSFPDPEHPEPDESKPDYHWRDIDRELEEEE